jgi:hypothetical protein
VWTPNQALPETKQFTQALPSLKAQCDVPYLYAYSPTMLSIDFEPHFLGSIRMVHNGSLSIMVLNPTQVVEAWPKLETKVTKPTCEAIRNWFITFTKRSGSDSSFTIEKRQEVLTGLKKNGIDVFHGTLPSDSALILPPGWLVAMASMQQKTVVGIRKAFLPKSSAGQAILSTVANCIMDNPTSYKAVRIGFGRVVRPGTTPAWGRGRGHGSPAGAPAQPANPGRPQETQNVI